MRLAALALALMMAGCMGGGPSPEPTPTPTLHPCALEPCPVPKGDRTDLVKGFPAGTTFLLKLNRTPVQLAGSPELLAWVEAPINGTPERLVTYERAKGVLRTGFAEGDRTLGPVFVHNARVNFAVQENGTWRLATWQAKTNVTYVPVAQRGGHYPLAWTDPYVLLAPNATELARQAVYNTNTRVLRPVTPTDRVEGMLEDGWRIEGRHLAGNRLVTHFAFANATDPYNRTAFLVQDANSQIEVRFLEPSQRLTYARVTPAGLITGNATAAFVQNLTNPRATLTQLGAPNWVRNATASIAGTGANVQGWALYTVMDNRTGKDVRLELMSLRSARMTPLFNVTDVHLGPVAMLRDGIAVAFQPKADIGSKWVIAVVPYPTR